MKKGLSPPEKRWTGTHKTRTNQVIPKLNDNPERDYKDPLRSFNPATSLIQTSYHLGLSDYSVKVHLFLTFTFEFESAMDSEKFFERFIFIRETMEKKPYSFIQN